MKKLLALAALVLACPSLADARPRKKSKKAKKEKKAKEPAPPPDREIEL
jgi:hypothetical protein